MDIHSRYQPLDTDVCRQFADALGNIQIAILADLCGPKIRVGGPMAGRTPTFRWQVTTRREDPGAEIVWPDAGWYNTPAEAEADALRSRRGSVVPACSGSDVASRRA